MNLYDITIITPDDKEIGGVEDHIKEAGGEIKNKSNLGVKPFSYPINKLNEGVYSIYIVDLSPEKLVELEKSLRLDQKIIRSIILKTKTAELPTFSSVELRTERKQYPVKTVPVAPKKEKVIVKEKPQETKARQKALNEKLEQMLKE